MQQRWQAASGDWRRHCWPGGIAGQLSPALGALKGTGTAASSRTVCSLMGRGAAPGGCRRHQHSLQQAGQQVGTQVVDLRRHAGAGQAGAGRQRGQRD